MSDVVIRAEGLGKKYIIGHELPRDRYSSLRDTISRGFKTLGRKASDMLHGRPIVQGDEIEEVWALRDLDFEIRRGEVVGIIGRNGAGKSTLLKILSRITEPSAGRVEITGRAASLLEIGTGFHAELSGRENIFLNGAILGMSRSEIRRKFDEIVAFSEVEKFLDTPVKRYSSGMYVRLAFAVAAHLDPEILIVDEVLAVGDVEFQRKCLGKLSDVARQEARTILFVSHNMAAIETLCGTAMLLSGGRVTKRGEVRTVVHAYLHDASEKNDVGVARSRKLARELTLDSIEFRPQPIESGAGVEFRISFSASTATKLNELTILVDSTLGVRVAIVDLRSAQLRYRVDPTLLLRGRILGLPLVEGSYRVGLFLECGVVRGEFLDLARLDIVRAPSDAEFPPYPAHDRGLVELVHEVQID